MGGSSTSISKARSSTFLGISKNTIKKCVVMFLIANLGYGLQLAYSTPVALSATFFKELKISEEQYGLLFSIYAIPNLFMIIIGGILIDILGTSVISVIFCGIAAFSSIFTVLSMPHFNLMMVGRFFLGMGGETLLACATTMIPLFYSPREVPICMGFLACWFYWGNLTALLALPTINSLWGFRAALWFVAIIFIIEFSLNLVLVRFRERLKWTDQIDRSASVVSLKHINSEVSMMTSEDSEMQDDSPTISLNGDQQVQEALRSKWEIFVYKLFEVKDMATKLSKRFWLLALICFISFYSMFGLAIIGTDVLEHKFGYDESRAALIMASEAIVNGILPMFTGMFIQRVRGRKIQLMMVACFILGLGTFLLNVTDVFPLPWILMCGVGFALLNTTLMSCVPLLVEISIVGTAYGIICTSYNLNIFIFPPILDTIKRRTNSYTIPLWILTICAIIAIMLLALLKYMDMNAPLNESLDSSYSTAGMDNPPEQIIDEENQKSSMIADGADEIIHEHSMNDEEEGDEEQAINSNRVVNHNEVDEPINSAVIN